MKIALSAYGMTSMQEWYKILNFLGLRDLDICVGIQQDVDVVIFDGGSDVIPELYGEVKHKSTTCHPSRDEFEAFLFRHYYNNTNARISGICRGSQFINVMMLGTLYQNYSDQLGYMHSYNHLVQVTSNSILCNRFLFHPFQIMVNSTHHQCVNKLGVGLIPTLIALDNITEGYESIDGRIRCVQSHPEFTDNLYVDRLKVLSYLIGLDKL